VLGTGTAGCAGLNGGAATAAELSNPGDLTFDARGNLYVDDRYVVDGECGVIVKVDTTGRTHVFLTMPID
jgi:hypothetical protein